VHWARRRHAWSPLSPWGLRPEIPSVRGPSPARAPDHGARAGTPRPNPVACYEEQTASKQDRPPLQSPCSWHCGDASPGVSQNPPGPQTVAVVQVQQSAFVWQPLRQKPSTQVLPLAQSVFDRQPGCGRTSGWHRPAEHMSCAGQSASVEQAPWQKPLTHVWLAGQSKLNTQVAPPVVDGWQYPAVHTSPVPQSADDVHPG
jgi:hypothetical protein